MAPFHKSKVAFATPRTEITKTVRFSDIFIN